MYANLRYEINYALFRALNIDFVREATGSLNFMNPLCTTAREIVDYHKQPTTIYVLSSTKREADYFVYHVYYKRFGWDNLKVDWIREPHSIAGRIGLTIWKYGKTFRELEEMEYFCSIRGCKVLDGNLVDFTFNRTFYLMGWQ